MVYSASRLIPTALGQLRIQTRLAVISEKITQVLEQAVSTEARARSAEELRISLNQLQRQNTHLREDLAHHQKLLAELRQEYVQVKNNYTKETQLWAKRQKSLEGELSNLSETLAKQAAAFAEVEALRRQKTSWRKHWPITPNAWPD